MKSIRFLRSIFPHFHAARLQQDCYYRHAIFERISENEIVMTFGEDNHATVLELLRWLGPDAELIEPKEWRSVMRDELKQMLASYRTNDTETNPR